MRTLPLTFLVLTTAVLLPGCSSNDEPTADARVDRGAPPADTSPTVDEGAADLVQPLADGQPDGAAPDGAPADGAGPDAAPPDSAAPDLPPPDAPLIHDLGPACGGGTVLHSYSAEMVICQGASSSQCDAAQICSGWRLCTATEYLAGGGKTTPAPAEAWLGACARDGGALHPPTDGACASCTGVASMRTTSWECDGSDDTATSAARVGVAAHDVCHRVGANSAANEAFWIAKPSDLKLSAAVCCR